MTFSSLVIHEVEHQIIRNPYQQTKAEDIEYTTKNLYTEEEEL